MAWLSTGIRAVDHCVRRYAPQQRILHGCYGGAILAMLNNNLRKIMDEKENRSVRTNCHLASWLSVCGLANVTLGMSHGIGHQLGARNNVPHGLTSRNDGSDDGF